MKRTDTYLTIILALCIAPTVALAGPKGSHKKKKLPHRGGTEKAAERATMREEAILDRIDTHAWKKDPEARDHRSSNLREYSNHTYKRIVRLLTIGAIEEADGKKFKEQHTAILNAAKEANSDGLDDDEKKSIRKELNTLNDTINKAIAQAEQGSNRTPIVNRAQHRFEELIEFGVRSGRLSTLEASSLRRKVTKLEATEKRLKSGELTTRERERLMEDVVELKRDIMQDLRD